VSDRSAIEWTDATWNPVRGCDKVSPGCAHCYAETFAERFRGVKGHPYEQGFDLRLVPEKLTEPLSWKKPRRVFVNSMSDLFQPNVGGGFIAAVFGIMQACQQHTFQLLTKRPRTMRNFFAVFRPEDVREYTLKLTGHMIAGGWTWPLPNVWLGVSVENQHFADERIPLLLQTPAAVRFISAEPLLERIDLAGFIPRSQPWKPYVECRHGYDACPTCDSNPSPALDWVIVGGESGPGARPFCEHWARGLVQQCRAAEVPCFVKQFGSNAQRYIDQHDAVEFPNLRSRKGGDPAEWPEDLRVREYPSRELSPAAATREVERAFHDRARQIAEAQK